jgi:antibiotic biosynthesis monooxygenase (ABM) superfamily enzyme
MASVLYMVKTAIEPEREAEYNLWYNEEHCPMMLRFPGAVSAHRYRSFHGTDGLYNLVAVYEFQDRATFERFLASDHAKAMYDERRRRFGPVLDARAEAMEQVWP